MNTETSKSARVNLELDFYDSNNKKFNKIYRKLIHLSCQRRYNKKHVLKYLDRKKKKTC